MTDHFHVTGRPNVDAILTEGLRTDAAGFDARYVWLFDDEQVAREAADGTCWGGHTDLVVLRVDTTGIDVIPDPHPGWGDDRDTHAAAVASNIPADRVEVIP